MTRTVAAVTTGRADFGHLEPIARRLAAEPSLRLRLLVVGGGRPEEDAALDAEIRGAGLAADGRVELDLGDGSAAGTARATGACVTAVADHFAAWAPDIVLLMGDRYEMLASAVAGAVSGCVLAHVSGGDLTTGSLDDAFRHAITKLSHLHFTTNEESSRRVVQMGEEEWRVHVVGEPSLDRLFDDAAPDPAALAAALGIPPAEWDAPLLVTLHPDARGVEAAAGQAGRLMRVLEDFAGWVVITAANRDPGGEAINDLLRGFAARRPRTRFVASLGWKRYAALMRGATAMLGNSSSGVLEAGAFELPVVNVGERQAGRLRGPNVLDVADGVDAMRSGLARAFDPEFRAGLRGMTHPYGAGRAAESITRVLASCALDSGLRHKRFREAS
jgi:UDP-hydrolysing UDP-N-acetyl-D-glucosamine 2-epimerase